VKPSQVRTNQVGILIGIEFASVGLNGQQLRGIHLQPFAQTGAVPIILLRIPAVGRNIPFLFLFCWDFETAKQEQTPLPVTRERRGLKFSQLGPQRVHQSFFAGYLLEVMDTNSVGRPICYGEFSWWVGLRNKRWEGLTRPICFQAIMCGSQLMMVVFWVLKVCNQQSIFMRSQGRPLSEHMLTWLGCWVSGILNSECRLLKGDTRMDRALFKVSITYQYSAAKELKEYFAGCVLLMAILSCQYFKLHFPQIMGRTREQRQFRILSPQQEDRNQDS
jgi:hypothetical protein